MPARTRACIGRRVRSRPAKWTLPESGCSAPETWWMKVVLPAPLGPISACTSPALTLKLTAFSASTAAKRRESWRTSSSGSAMALPEQGGNALGGKEDDGQQEQAEDDVPVFSDADQAFFQQQQDDRAHDTAVEVADAADDDHHQQGAGLRPLQQVGAGQPGEVGEQRASQPGEGAAEHEGEQAVAEDRIAKRRHARFVLADGLQRAPEAGVGEA